MSAGEALRRAAARIDSGYEIYSCWALCWALGIKFSQAELIEHPTGAIYADFFGGHFPRVYSMHEEDEDQDRWRAKQNRILALCMAATLADDPEWTGNSSLPVTNPSQPKP